MGFRPPKGVRPPQLEGKRTGRPKGSRNHAHVWDDVLWGYQHRYETRANYPNQSARMWWTFAAHYPDALETVLEDFGKI